MKEPRKPNEEECCNSGCNPCIFDVYEKQLELYKKYQQGKSGPSEENAISQLEYRPFRILESRNICDEHKLLLFKGLENKKLWWKPGSYFLTKFKSDSAQLTRAYTPLKISSNMDKDYDFEIVIKKYDNGIVSKYMYDLNNGEEILWRGPYGIYDLKDNSFDRIIMIAQGTGIAPFLSIIEHILKNEDMTKIVLYYCCPSVDKVLFRNQLYSYRSFWNFKYNIHVNNSTNHALKYQEPVKFWRLCSGDFCDLKPISSKDQCLVCGSEEFMKYFQSVLSNMGAPMNNIILF